MPKADKRTKSAGKAKLYEKTLYGLVPWSCRHHGERSAIEAYVMASGEWEIIAEVRSSAYVVAEETANFIVRAVNDYERHQKLIGELASALELCLECQGITWEAEQEASVVLRKIKNN